MNKSWPLRPSTNHNKDNVDSNMNWSFGSQNFDLILDKWAVRCCNLGERESYDNDFFQKTEHENEAWKE